MLNVECSMFNVPSAPQAQAMSRAVTVGLSGGLGNQMFQYAAGRALSLRLGAPLLLDNAWFLGRKDRAYGLGNFLIQASIRDSDVPGPDVVKSLESRVSRKWGRKRMGVEIFREPHFQFSPEFLELKSPVYLEGYWQSERYFDSCREVIASDFALRGELPRACLDIRDEILATDAIGIHIRRGDYVSDPATARVHELCPPEYYVRGLALAVSGLARPHGFVFSDDPDWARANFSAPIPTTFVDVNSPGDACWDLHLMAACRNFVIANSSLSWWAAWLGGSPDKRVVAPQNWFKPPGKNTADLIPESWIKV